MIGIDYGTTRLKMANIDPAGNPNVILNDRGEPFTLSAVFFSQSGEPLVGADAIEQGYLDPERCVKNSKLNLGSPKNLLNNGQKATATDTAAVALEYLKDLAEKQLGIEVTDCVVTCPANFRDDSKQALLEACERAGLKVLRLVPEPTAAGLAYALNKGGDDKYCLVYDFGGGTFDVSILHIQGSQITVLATAGVAELGGNDLNKCIEKRVLDNVQAKFSVMPSPEKDPFFFMDLAQRAEAAKISLNNRKKVPIAMSYKGNQAVTEISQEDFHKDIGPFIQQSLDAVHKALDSAGLKNKDIDHLVMVGGTSRIQHIQEKVADDTGLCPKTDIDPDKAIAYGAAYASIVELDKRGKTAKFRGQVIPSPEIFIRDVTAHSVGCCVVDTSELKRNLINSVIIDKNTPIPCQRSDQFYLEHEDQINVRVEILQGESKASRDDCLLIGELNLTNLPKETIRTPRISVEYTIDANGMVTATATDKVSGQTQTVSVDYKKGVKPKDKPHAA